MSELRIGAMIDGYQLTAQAPVDYIRGTRQRVINGRYVTGSWSDPWWGYHPERGWAVIKRWRNDALPATNYSAAVPALDTVVIDPWEEAA
jgi:hypothetical protein